MMTRHTIRPTRLGDTYYAVCQSKRTGWGTYAYTQFSMYTRDEAEAMAHAASLKGWERFVVRYTCTQAPTGKDGWGEPTGYEIDLPGVKLAEWKIVKRDGKPVIAKVA